ncbi:lipid-binding SYLF domain-containing protein [Kaarinaea lacus]
MGQIKTLHILLILIASMLAACSSQPVKVHDLSQTEVSKAHEAISFFKQKEKLAPFFKNAVAYAVYPDAGRAGLGFGAAYASGLVFQDKKIIGTTVMTQVNVGFNMGGQWYRQIVFFRTPEVLDHFKNCNLEMGGQANAALITLGGGATPGFLNDVAIFTELRGGLLIEVSIGGHYYSFSPVISADETVSSVSNNVEKSSNEN